MCASWRCLPKLARRVTAGVKWAVLHRWAKDLHGLPAPPDRFIACMVVEDSRFQRGLREGLVLGVLWAGGHGRLHLRDQTSGAFVTCAHTATLFDELVLQHAVRVNGLCVEPIESLLVCAADGSLEAFASRRDQIDWALVDALLERSEPGNQRQRLAEWWG